MVVSVYICLGVVLAIDKVHGRGPSNEIRPQLQLKKTVLAVNVTAKVLYAYTLYY